MPDDQRGRFDRLPPESPHPTVRRIGAGSFLEGPDYRVRRSGGTADWLLIHTVAGSGRLRVGTAEALRTQPGDGVLLSPGTVHDYRTEPGVGRWSLLFAHFHPRSEWRPLLHWPLALPGIGRIALGHEADERVRLALGTSARSSLSQVSRPELLAMNALETALLWYDVANPGSPQLDERVQQVIEFIEQHLEQDIDADRLARVAHLSESRTSHLFTEQVGISPLRYLENQRMVLAAQLLEFTGRPVSGIAREVGYLDPLYFSRRFRRFHGCSPSAHRQQTRSRPPDQPHSPPTRPT